MKKISKANYHFFVKGIVQGVGFRYFAIDLARYLKLTGFVKNISDGQVEIEVEGEKRELERFMQKIKEGPRMAVVHEIIGYQEQEVKNFENFEIRF